MIITIPKFDERKDLFRYLIDNKRELITKKRELPITSDPLEMSTTLVNPQGRMINRANNEVENTSGILRVKVVASASNWINSHMDMDLPGAADKSIRERFGMIPMLHDHIYQLGAQIGDVIDIYTQQMSIAELGAQFGIQARGTTEALIFVTDLLREYNPMVFDLYRQGKVNQHSIGLQYMDIDLAVNTDEEFWETERDVWNKFYPQVLNKETADREGFFWVIKEYKLIENSAVLFGSNELTPTLDNNMDRLPMKVTEDSREGPSRKIKDTRMLEKLQEVLQKLN